MEFWVETLRRLEAVRKLEHRRKGEAREEEGDTKIRGE